MRIALFYPYNILAAYAPFAYRETLERMGHQVVDCSFPGNQVQDVPNIKKKMPTIEELNRCDVVLSSYHEYVQPWLAAVYGFEAWSQLKVPVIARFDESMDRGDLGLPARMPELMRWGQHHSFPAAQDAKKFGGKWLPFGSDVTIFKPFTKSVDALAGMDYYSPKKYDLAFIGTLYPARHKYLEQLAPHLPVTFQCGNAIVQDLSGVRARESMELLAENYRQIKIFFCLPPISKLLIEKMFSVMACGTFMMYPRFPGSAMENCSIFEDGEHLLYYEQGYVANNAKQIKYFLQHEYERERIARAGCELIHSKYTLEGMLNELLAPIKVTA